MSALLSTNGSTSTAPREPLTQEEANRIINDIHDEQGYLDDTQVRFLEPAAVGRTIRKRFDNLRLKATELVNSTTTINSNDAHFIPELLQNADDARYLSALGENEQPWIRFRVTQNTIRIETNEDGFSRKDVEAICETGASSKKDSQNQHIGEKGIGFKSIFRVAEKVEIDSGLWHFHFNHFEDDDGLGMVTPLLHEPVEIPDTVGTRITIHLNARYRGKRGNILRESFRTLPDTTIFFLRNISRIEIAIDAKPLVQTIVITMAHAQPPGRRTLSKTFSITTDPESTLESPSQAPLSSIRYFQVFSSGELTMPKDKRRHHNIATVLLAFPINNTGTSAVLDKRGEHVFAFLPMYRETQLKFLIQSDFITTASRETTEDCDWNDCLIKATAETFCQAIEYFCRQNILRYEWLKFIPTEPINGDWASLGDCILAGLMLRRVFATSNSAIFRMPHQVRRIPELFKHKHTPLLIDLTGDDEVYLAEEYEGYPVILDLLEVPWLSTSASLDRLEDDLKRPDSMLKTTDASSSWHEAMSLWMLDLYEDDSEEWSMRLESMPIIPLKSSTWTSATPEPHMLQQCLKFPAIQDVMVPEGLGYTMLDTHAVSHPTRKRLFEAMGVSTCEVSAVIEEIKSAHKKRKTSKIPLFVDHLYFCYHSAVSMADLRPNIWIITEARQRRRLTSKTYLPSDKPYSTSYLANSLACDYPDKKLVYDDWLLHSLYVDDRLTDQPTRGCSWKKWLCDQAKIEEIPALTVADTEGRLKVSPVLEEVLSVSSLLFLETLQAHWNYQYYTECMTSKLTLSCLQNCKVTCQNEMTACLRDVYLPCDEVTMRAQELSVEGCMDIVQLTSAGRPLNLSDWTFLEQLGVRTTVDVEFHLQALRLMGAHDISEAIMAYEYISANAKRSEAGVLAKRFEDERLICVFSGTGPPFWCCLSDCVWEGPGFLTISNPIAECYQKNQSATHLFRTLLEIRDANWKDLVEQLRYAKAHRGANFSVKQASEIYLGLNSINGVNWEELRETFTREQLVFVPEQWSSPDICLWSSVVQITGRPVLGVLYSQLEVFFTRHLKIQKVRLPQVIRELARKAGTTAKLTASVSKHFLIQISSMLATEDVDDDSLAEYWDELIQTSFLPVRCGTETPRLVDCSSPFVIGDSYEYNQAFAGQCAFLDISFEEIPQVSRVLRALPLEMNWLSEIVGKTSVVQGDSARDEALSWQLQQKAAFLFSCAYKYHSPQAQSPSGTLFEELQNMSVYVCTTIATKLVLDFEGIDATSVSEGAQVVLETGDNGLSLFVPENQKKRRSSFRSSLPHQLLELWEVEDDRAWTCLVLILTTDLSDLEDLMKTENLPRVPWLDPEVYEVPCDESDQEASSPTLVSESSSPNAREYTTRQSAQISYDGYDGVHKGQRVRARGRTSVSLDPVFLPVVHPGSDYKVLLHQIVQCARRKNSTKRDSNGKANAFDLSSLDDVLPATFDTTSVLGVSGMERNFRIGAAGELYVFERLKQLGLSDFGITNWRSRIRKYVAVHPDYAGMANWDARETADIVYQDRNGKLQEWLRQVSCNGFPDLVDGDDRSGHIGRTCYLEVKSTTSADCDTEFYMSRGEYELMNSMRLGINRDPEQVYVIIRVFRLMDHGIAFKVFVDPCRYQDETVEAAQPPSLRFEVEKWEVYPSTSGLACH